MSGHPVPRSVHRKSLAVNLAAVEGGVESLYILTYFVILAVAINSVLLVAQPNLKLFRDYDNMWAEVIYWPAILLTLVVITLVALF